MPLPPSPILIYKGVFFDTRLSILAYSYSPLVSLLCHLPRIFFCAWRSKSSQCRLCSCPSVFSFQFHASLVIPEFTSFVRTFFPILDQLLELLTTLISLEWQKHQHSTLNCRLKLMSDSSQNNINTLQNSTLEHINMFLHLPHWGKSNSIIMHQIIVILYGTFITIVIYMTSLRNVCIMLLASFNYIYTGYLPASDSSGDSLAVVRTVHSMLLR